MKPILTKEPLSKVSSVSAHAVPARFEHPAFLNRKLLLGNTIILILTIALPCVAEYDPVYARNGMVAGPEPHATAAGLEILEKGGNAFDAAVAMGFALAVTYPAAGNLGGGGFLVGLCADREEVAFNFREKAPAKATRDMYLDENGDVVEGRSTETLLGVGVPGTVHGLLRTHETYGTLKRRDVLSPAIHLAQKGFPVGYNLAQSLRDKQEKLTRFDSTAALFYPDGEPLKFGDTLVQRDLGRTLRAIRKYGAKGFYEGRTADRIVEYMREHGGIITHQDLENYTAQQRKPFTFTYKNYRLVTHPLPSSGGVTLGQILKLLEPFPLQEMGYGSAEYIHTVVEAERLAFADRNHHLGDPVFVKVPQEELIADAYVRERRELMPRGKAGKSEGVQPGAVESMETTHYCVVDRDRNVVAVTYTLNSLYGMGAVVEGAGFFLNNEMDDFTAKPGTANQFGLVEGEANAIEPGKRMLSSMTPTIVLKDGAFDFTMGTPGGPTIITTNLQVFLNVAEFGMNVREAIDAPRFHHQWLPDEIRYEKRAFSPDTSVKLEAMGYTLDDVEGTYGFAVGIQATDDGLLAGYADGRGSGAVLGN